MLTVLVLYFLKVRKHMGIHCWTFIVSWIFVFIEVIDASSCFIGPKCY